MEIFQRYDIRGDYPKELNADVALRLGRSLGSMAHDIVLCGDNRVSTPLLKKAFAAGAMAVGANVIDVGTGPTDYLAFCSKRLKTTGCMVTASHLSPSWNGFKFLYSGGNSFVNEDLNKVKEIYLKNKFRELHGQAEEQNLLPEYLKAAEDVFHRYFQKVEGKVIVDCAGGVTGLTTPVLLERLGAEVVRLDTYGVFTHPEPTREALTELARAAAGENCLGVAHDLDGDRVAAFGPEWLNGNQIFALLAQILEPKKIVASIDTSRLLTAVTEEIHYTEVGDPFVLRKMIDINADFSGEPNGHYCVRDFVPYNSGTMAALLLAGLGSRIPNAIESLPRYTLHTEKVKVKDKKKTMSSIVKKVKAKYKVLAEMDGIKFSYEGADILIRPSGTEPVIRVMIESSDRIPPRVHREVKGLF